MKLPYTACKLFKPQYSKRPSVGPGSRCSGVQPFRARRYLSAQSHFVKIAEEIHDAVHISKRPVVALESAIYTHGFPYPENVALASRLESLVRVNGAVPASIGIIDGIARIGLSADELITLTTSAGQPTTRKVSRRDLAYVCSPASATRKLHGGTTISSTALLAEMAGIQIFATGGLGGVHRNGENSMDVSADLTELGRTKVAVISSGCKGFLDIPRTLEYLETQGVGVITLADGREGPIDFPAFWSRESGVRSPLSVVDEYEAASIIFAQNDINLKSGLLFANPIPNEHAFPRQHMEAIIAQALEDARAATSIGSENTPFVLNRIRELTDGRSVMVNRALIEANVVCAAKIAVQLAKLSRNHGQHSSMVSKSQVLEDHIVLSDPSQVGATPRTHSNAGHEDDRTVKTSNATTNQVVIAGSIALDLTCDFDLKSAGTSSKQFQLHTSNPVSIRENVGGVGRNVASAIGYLGIRSQLCTIVGKDTAGLTALDSLKHQGISTSAVRRLGDGASTARYISLNNADKDLHLAAADMSILTAVDKHQTLQYFTDWIDGHPQWTIVDANWSSKTIRHWLDAAKTTRSKTAFEPVSIAKAGRLFELSGTSSAQKSLPVWPNDILDLATPNALELRAMWEAARNSGEMEREDWFNVVNDIGLADTGGRDKLEKLTNSNLVNQGIPQQCIQLLPFIPCITTTLGRDGVLLLQILGSEDERLRSSTAARYILPSPLGTESKIGGIYVRLFPPATEVPKVEIVSVNGVGDTFLGALVAGIVQSESSHVEEIIDFAQECAVHSLKSEEAVSPALSLMRENMIMLGK